MWTMSPGRVPEARMEAGDHIRGQNLDVVLRIADHRRLAGWLPDEAWMRTTLSRGQRRNMPKG